MDDSKKTYDREDLKRMALPLNFDPTSVPHHMLDVPYGTLASQLLDLYLPDPVIFAPPYPTIIYCHGGGFMEGTRRLGALHSIIDAVKRGYAVLAPDYRLSPEFVYPAFVQDVKTAVRWARAHAGLYGLDPQRFAVVGDSAGGYLSLMLAATPNLPELAGSEYGWPDQSDAVQACCDLYGLADMGADEAAWFAESGVERLNFSLPGGLSLAEIAFGISDPAVLSSRSPIAFVSAALPPTLIHHGLADAIVPYQHSVAFKAAADAVCPPERVELKLYPGCAHCDNEFMTVEHCSDIVDFLDRALSR